VSFISILRTLEKIMEEKSLIELNEMTTFIVYLSGHFEKRIGREGGIKFPVKLRKFPQSGYGLLLRNCIQIESRSIQKFHLPSLGGAKMTSYTMPSIVI
jgi:hypothetical protein